MINLIKIGDAYNVPIKEYEVDETSELNQINNAPVGSVATVNSTGDTYKLRSTGSWTKSSSGGGSTPSGGSDLPDVTAVDNGKVLTVVNGSWDKADPQGGGSLPTPGNAGNVLTSTGSGWESAAPDVAYPIIHGTVDTRVTPLAMTITETDEQILAAVATGKPILLQYTVITAEGTSIPSYHFCNAAVTILSNVACAINAFINTGINNGAVQYFKTEIYIGVSSEPGVTRQIILTPIELNSLPMFGSLDSGKVLSINNSGALTWITNNSNVPYIVHLEVNLGAGTATVTDGKTIADILAVADSNPNVYAEFAFGTGHGRLPLVGWDSNTALGESTVTFSGVSVGAKGILIEGENDGTNETWTITPES